MSRAHCVAEAHGGAQRLAQGGPRAFGLLWYLAMARLSLLTSATAAMTSGSSKPWQKRGRSACGVSAATREGCLRPLRKERRRALHHHELAVVLHVGEHRRIGLHRILAEARRRAFV